MSKEKTIKISVRNLVEFVFREGDIVSGGTGVRNVEAMQLGSRIHRKIQKSMGVGYESEVPLFTMQKFKSAEYEEDFSLKIEGRADGIFTDGDLTVIDEIKGVVSACAGFGKAVVYPSGTGNVLRLYRCRK